MKLVRRRCSWVLGAVAGWGCMASGSVGYAATDPVVTSVAAEVRPEAPPEAPPWDARVGVMQLHAEDSLGEQQTDFTDLRLTLNVPELTISRAAGVSVDARVRQGWQDDSAQRRYDVTRAYGEWRVGVSPWRMRIGRQVVREASAARVDGAAIERRLGDEWHVATFGGLSPHPLTGDLDPRFLTAGLVYGREGRTERHSGGLAIRTYEGSTDRVFFSEQLYLRLGESWSLMGRAVLDFLSTEGIVDELAPRYRSTSRALKRPDVTQLHLRLGYRPVRWADMALSGWHAHTLLPRLWWDDWLEEQRATHGVIVDGLEPVGTRRSTARLQTTLRLSRVVVPYAQGRFDYRHNDEATGYEGRGGVKVMWQGGGFLNLFAAKRRYFDADNTQAGLAVAHAPHRLVQLETGVTATLARSTDARPRSWVYDVYGQAVASLGGYSLIMLYQGFVEDDLLQHIGLVSLSYRQRGA